MDRYGLVLSPTILNWGRNGYMKKQLTGIGIVLTVLTLVADSGLTQGPPGMLVVTGEVKSMEFNDQVTLVGRTQARRSGNIVAEVSGRVLEVNSDEGVSIQRGSPLVTIDSKRLSLSFEARDADAKQAEVQAELARTLLRRAEELYGQQLISESAIDSARAFARITEETFRRLKVERDQLALDVARCTVRAPYTGYTGRQLINVGEWVSPGSEVFEMIDPSRIKVVVDLPERHFGHLKIGSEAAVYLSSDPDNVIIGQVTGISPNASSSTHTFPVIVTVDNRDGRLGGGMLVRVIVSLNEKFISLAVEKDAIIRQGGNTMVYTVVDGKAAPIPVITSSTRGQMIAIAGEGVAEGMPVVIRGNERIWPGADVRQAGDKKSP